MTKDPYKYFRVEARELLEALVQGVLQLEKAPAPDTIPRLLRAAHTLKGAARVVKQARVADLAHEVEEVLTQQRGAVDALPESVTSALLAGLDEIADLLRALETPEAGGPTPLTQAQELDTIGAESVRVDRQDIDSLLQMLCEAGIHAGTARRRLTSAERTRDLAGQLLDTLEARAAPSSRGDVDPASALAEQLHASLRQLVADWSVDLDSVSGSLAQAEQAVHQLQLIPAATIFPALDRAVRDAAGALRSQVDFRTEGGDVELDAQVLASLRAALMHVVRNAVAHGIEPAAERVAAGKPSRGAIMLSVERSGGRVAFRCQDDGRGVDIDAVRGMAVERGRLDALTARSLSRDAVLALLGSDGFSTSAGVDAIAGRGIGLDVARTTAQQLNGEFRLHTTAGRGSTVEIEVPVLIASITSLLVSYSEGVAALPLDAVQHVMRIGDSDLTRSADGLAILFEGRVIPFLPLDSALQLPSSARPQGSHWHTVVVRSGVEQIAVGVDGLLGAANITLRTLPEFVVVDPVVAGASLDDEGNPRLMLDPHGIALAARTRGGGAAPSAGPAVGGSVPAPPAPILIVDDSLTTRMLEQSILESAGYLVELAVSAEEALIKARDGSFSLFLVDVEMPGMDGFEFVETIRSDARLGSTPAILVTSRNSQQDFLRGARAGANAYIVKGEFDQRQLLSTISSLVRGT